MLLPVWTLLIAVVHSGAHVTGTLARLARLLEAHTLPLAVFKCDRDYCTAADHMINAGLATGMNSNCTLTGFLTFNPAAHPMKGMIRDNDPRRLALGNGFMGGINAMFGAGSVVPTYGSIDTLGPIVFFMYPQGQTADWSFYTFGYGLGGPFPDHMYDLYAAADAGSYCGGGAGAAPGTRPIGCHRKQTITTPKPKPNT